MNYSEDRSFLRNFCYFLFAILGIYIVPIFVSGMASKFIHNDNVLDIVSDVLFILILFLIYEKDLVREFKTFIKNFKKNISTTFKYYICGVMLMAVFNLLINTNTGVSQNEGAVREMLFTNPGLMLISISILAPICEELVFRKSIRPLIKNKWLYAICCGLLFGLAHLMINFVTGTFVLKDLLYLLPYGSLGGCFAIMDYESDSVFSSIMMHAFHNTWTALLLLLIFNLGVM